MSALHRRRIGRALWIWGPALVLTAAIFAVSHSSAPPFAGSVPDYWAHMGIYALLSAAVLHGLQRGDWRNVTLARVVVAVLLSAGYGLTDEYHQAFVPGRTPSARDVAADVAGGVVGAGGAWVWSIVLAGRRGRRHTSHGS
ncbi:MAG: VanZ family protein [Acidobacteria bacterium]|nr:VanZ family protein [Acidobacteriota bacterium]MYJ03329.1 VanZ family protein [Acidobacteriota bacterium]